MPHFLRKILNVKHRHGFVASTETEEMTTKNE